MPKKYAIRITEDNLALIQLLDPIMNVEVIEDRTRYFLFTVGAIRKTTEQDIVHEDDLAIYDGNDLEPRVIIQ